MMGCCQRRGDSVISFVIPWLCLAGSVAGFTARELGSRLEARRNRLVSLRFLFWVMRQLVDADDDG